MMKLIKVIIKGTTILFNFILKFWLTIFALGIILGIAYILGAEFLFGLMGNDSQNNLMFINWFGRFFPKIPLWFPLQGAGVSIALVYPLGSHFLTILLSRITDLSSIAAYQAIGFLSVPLTAFGIFLFVWLRLTKSQVAGFIAAVLYLIAPISWGWLYGWGFFAEAVSYPFALLFLILADTYLDWSVKEKKGFASRLLFFITCLSLGLLYFFHPTTFFGFLVVLGFYSLFRFGLLMGRKAKKDLPLAILALAKIGLVTFLLIFFFLKPSYSYLSYAKRWPTTGLSKEDFVKHETLHLKHFFGLAKYGPKDPHFASRFNYFSIPVWTLAILGFLVSIRFSKKALSIGLFCLLALLVLFNPAFIWYLSRVPIINFFAGLRTFMMGIRILLPCLGAFGAWALWVRIFSLSITKRRKIKGPIKLVVGTLAAVLSLALSGYLIWQYRVYPPTPDKIEYGMRMIDQRDIFDFSGRAEDYQDQPPRPLEEQLALKNWPRPEFKAKIPRPGFDLAFEKIVKQRGAPERIDISPTLGGVVMEFNIFHDTSLVNLYTTQLSLISPYWFYQQMAFYGDQDEAALTEVAKWFGTSYSFINPKLDHPEKYENSPDWEKEEGIDIWRFLPKTGVFSWQKKPAILVIGSKKKVAYEPVFRMANLGAIPFERATLVTGREYIDAYKLPELKKFDLVFLFGYSYKNKNKAYQLLDQYLSEGGNLFISTGWQFEDRDWQATDLPSFFPMETLYWSIELGRTRDYKIGGKEIVGQINPREFSPLRWKDDPWGVSLPEKVRSWAKPLLLARDRPLVLAGEYGKGKVVWAGINLPAHILTLNKNPEEVKFVANIIDWLLPPALPEGETKISREWPDRVEVTFDQTLKERSLFTFKEAYHPYWQAEIKGGPKLSVYETGPALMGIFLPPVEKGDQLVLEFDPGLGFKAGQAISLTTLLVLISYLFLGRRTLPGEEKAKVLVSQSVKRFKSYWDKEE
jgi:hypothetical protein